MKLKLPQLEGEIDKDDYDFLQKISSSDLVGLLGGDWIKYWRWNNLLKIAAKVRFRSEELSLDVKLVSPKFLSDFFEASSLEDNDTLQDMWANLLLSKCVYQATNTCYITVLRNLEPIEAELINLLYFQGKKSVDTNFDFQLVLKSSVGISEDELSVMIHKMYSFNILRPPINKGIQMGSYPPAVETIEAFRFTELGIDFCKRCNGVESSLR